MENELLRTRYLLNFALYFWIVFSTCIVIIADVQQRFHFPNYLTIFVIILILF